MRYGFTHTVTAILFVVSVFATACQKSVQIALSKPVFSDDYIEGTIDGLDLKAKYASSANGASVVYNSYFPNEAHVQMKRETASNTLQGWDIHVDNINMDTIRYPIILKYNAGFRGPQMYVTYRNGIKGEEGEFVVDNSDTTFQLTLSSFTDDVVKGTFNGILMRSDSNNILKTVTNGSFKIKLVRWQ